MEKRALGKGLDQLMSGQSVRKPFAGAAPRDSAASSKVTPVDFGRGMNTLVGTRAEAKAEPERARLSLPAWFFFAADLLLLAYTVAICLDAGGPLGLGEIIFAAVSTTLGALLAIFGVVRVAENSSSGE